MTSLQSERLPFDPAVRRAPTHFMRQKTILLFASVLMLSVYAAQPASSPPKLQFPQAGFSIAPLDSAPGNGSMPLAMSLAPVNGPFSTNVNVVIQPFTKTMGDYVALSKPQFVQAGLTIVSEQNPNSNEWIIEYKGLLGGKNLHFYAHAMAGNGLVYLATGTALEEQWSGVANQVKSCVDSLKTNTIAAAPVPAAGATAASGSATTAK